MSPPVDSLPRVCFPMDERTTARHEQPSRQAVLSRLMVAAVILLPAFKCLLTLPVDDPDVWWHLRAGQWIVEHRGLPTTDSFSAGGSGRPWVAYSWTAELLLYGLYSALGLRGLLVFTAAVSSALVASFHGLLRRVRPPGSLDLILALVATLGLLPVLTPRPWLFTIWFFILELDLLLTAGRTGDRRLLWWLVPLFVLWANVHIQFVLGLVVLAMAAIEPLVARLLPVRRIDPEWRPVPFTFMLVLGVACVAATLVNPYHGRLYLVAAQLMGQSELWNLIQELVAMPFRSPSNWVVLAAALAAAFALGWRRRFRPLVVMLFLLGAYLSFRSQRDVWLVLLVSLAILADTAAVIRPRAVARRVGWTVPVAAVLVVVLAGSFLATQARLEKKVEEKFPVGAVRFLAAHRYPGPLFNRFSWGGYLIFFLPEYPVSIDGRTMVHGQKRLIRHFRTLRGKPEWKKDPELAAARLVVVPSRGPLAALLQLAPRFRPVYQDRVATVFCASDRPDS
ncbi:MAG TPA: hypothetical protein EYP56_11155 [Planctomycetaceae bacterium]|nr:hypothetical protein [Planctomycetaceae bacterium]